MMLVRWVTGGWGLTRKCSGTAYLAIFAATSSLSSWRMAVGLSLKPSFKTTKANGTEKHKRTHKIEWWVPLCPAGGSTALKVSSCISDILHNPKLKWQNWTKNENKGQSRRWRWVFWLTPSPLISWGSPTTAVSGTAGCSSYTMTIIMRL